ncbi:MAG: hypothetical protein GEV28_01635 [Actinophytocola sp.]|uniref:hypothetical protein n=1 Tax=Actinophytocola sp. TaxID=1872138 RepID=UPI001327CEBF|nr:hypothetical protein [Actinophytocola sp.]MPZ79154.1 hypothetical protein [Actinophytocola sp.]
MTIAVGIFDLFAYSVPGALYLGLLSYLAVRTGAVEPATLNGVNSFVVVAAAVLLAYLLGFVAYPMGALMERVVPRFGRRDAREEFLRRTPVARDRAYPKADTFLLFAGLQLHALEASADVSRLRASGLMLRNSAPPLLFAAVAAVVEMVAGDRPVLAVTCAVGLVATALLLVGQARKLSRWATIKTLELSFWVPDVDERFRGEPGGSA